MRKLFLSLVFIAVVVTLLIPTTKTQATPADCDTVAQVCRDMSQMMYNVCILSGGSASDCAWQEAVNTLNCMKNNGCGDLVKTGSN
jgi:hypothetical protein